MGYGGMPKDLMRPDMDEITSQPLLNYVVALSYRERKVDFERENNLNLVYADLVDSVFRRSWGHRHKAIQGIDKELFERVLAEIALSMWQSGQRHASLRDIRKRCERKLRDAIDAFASGVEGGITRVLMAFYPTTRPRQ
jgi:hypothetical protein